LAARHVRDVEAPGSNPGIPTTTERHDLGLCSCFGYGGSRCSPIAHIGAEDESGDNIGGRLVQRRQCAGVGVEGDATVACPSRSLITLGGTPAASPAVA
jgi:hypothetical protein